MLFLQGIVIVSIDLFFLIQSDTLASVKFFAQESPLFDFASIGIAPVQRVIQLAFNVLELLYLIDFGYVVVYFHVQVCSVHDLRPFLSTPGGVLLLLLFSELEHLGGHHLVKSSVVVRVSGGIDIYVARLTLDTLFLEILWGADFDRQSVLFLLDLSFRPGVFLDLLEPHLRLYR